MPPKAKKRRKVYMGPDPAYVIPKQTKSNRAARAKRAAELNLSQTSGDGDNSSRGYDLDDSNQSSDSNEDEITSGVTSDDQATSDGDNESDDTSEDEALFHDPCTSEDGLASGDTSGSSETGETASSGGDESEQEDPDLTTSDEDESDFKIFEELCSGPPIPGLNWTRGHVLLLILAYVVSAGLSWTQTEGLLRLVNTLFGAFVAPKSKFLFRKVLQQNPATSSRSPAGQQRGGAPPVSPMPTTPPPPAVTRESLLIDPASKPAAEMEPYEGISHLLRTTFKPAELRLGLVQIKQVLALEQKGCLHLQSFLPLVTSWQACQRP
ncbi:hypothetical protein HPB47_018127 [Ixodes persulcatus]|uniref:Uncharacterized protein n=1 Tax=Ixodes persulcatus TaxID=34615 RepID=A0AC60QLL8_IXOPE|nr:hypothetical protein HPB47_018127 [Ixodes persulcatus]